jgi:hypothetical protein
MSFFRAGSPLRNYGLALLIACALALPVAAANSAQDAASREFKKTLPLTAGQTLSIENKFGEVRIHGENSHEALISATIRSQAVSQSQAEKFAESVKIEVTQDAHGITVRTVAPSDNPLVFRVGHKNSYSVDYDIAVPSDAKLWVKNDFGNVEIRGVRAWNDVENSHGELTARDVGSSKLSNSFGAIDTEGAAGDLTVVNSNGSVTVSAVKGTLDIKDRFGSITAKNIQGSVTIVGGNGSIELTDAGNSKVNNSFGRVSARNIHGTLSVNNNNGAIEVNTVSGSADLNGSFGAITFANVSGYVKCTSNNGRVTGGPAGDEVYVRNSFGDVSLEQINGKVEVEDSNGTITLHEIKGSATMKTSFGAIEASDLRNYVRATTGNGRISLADVGGEVFAKTSFGAVIVQRVNGNLTIENANGQVTANSIKGDTNAKTSFAAVTLGDISGHITVDNQNGAVMLTVARTPPACNSISVKTSFSPIQVRIPEGAGYTLTARTSFGRINSELPVTTVGQLGGDSLNGKIGNGACTLSLTNANGNIDILKLAK